MGLEAEASPSVVPSTTSGAAPAANEVKEEGDKLSMVGRIAKTIMNLFKGIACPDLEGKRTTPKIKGNTKDKDDKPKKGKSGNSGGGGVLPGGDGSSSKLTGSKSLLVYILERDGQGQFDYNQMHKKSGQWDFVAVPDIKTAENLLRKYYAGGAPHLNQLVINAHGNMNTGMVCTQDGLLENASGNESLKYISSLLANNVNVCITACCLIQDYGSISKEGIKATRLGNQFVDVFLAGTNRTLYMNTMDAITIGSYDTDNVLGFTDKDIYWFWFDSQLIKNSEKGRGFLKFSYDCNKRLSVVPDNGMIIKSGRNAVRLFGSKFRGITPNAR